MDLTELEQRAAKVLEDHRWLTSIWRCACEPRDVSHDVSPDTLAWHAGHVAEEFALAGLIPTGATVEYAVEVGDGAAVAFVSPDRAVPEEWIQYMDDTVRLVQRTVTTTDWAPVTDDPAPAGPLVATMREGDDG